MPTPRLFEQLRRAIAESGLTNKEVADRSGISQTILSLWLRAGTRGLSIETAEKIAAGLGLSIALVPDAENGGRRGRRKS